MLVSCHLGRLGHFTERLPANKKLCPPMVQIIRFIVSGASPIRYSGFYEPSIIFQASRDVASPAVYGCKVWGSRMRVAQYKGSLLVGLPCRGKTYACTLL